MAGWIKKIWRFIGSRTFAVWMLCIVIVILTGSAFLPNKFTITEQEMERLIRERPFLWMLSENLSTPEIVTSPVFIAVSFFLGLSTLVCTIKRLRNISRHEFSKRRAFNFSIKDSARDLDTALNSLMSVLQQKRWELKKERAGRGAMIIKAHKGRFGLWGSMIFHISLIALFLTAAISSASRFNGEIILTKGFDISASDVSSYSYISGRQILPDFILNVDELYLQTKGKMITQLKGILKINSKRHEFAVNRPVSINGYQFSPSRYGVSPRFVIKNNEQIIFDSFVNLRSLFMDDYFEIKEEGLRLNVRFFPDFYKQDGRFSTKTFDEKNPVFLIKVFSNGNLQKDIFIRQAEEATVLSYNISIPEYTHWVAMEVSRDIGAIAFIVCFFIGLIGLCIRFLSNERVLTCILYPDGTFELRGWSRYYPAFLEKELLNITKEVLNP